MTTTDARRALREMVSDIGPTHAAEVQQKIEVAEREALAAAAAASTPDPDDADP